jgi:hypothetical protein
MVSRMAESDAGKVAELFAQHDATDLPRQVGLTGRTLLHYQGLTFHLIESEEDIIGRIREVHADDREFRELSERLRPFLSPIVSDWSDVRDSRAREFYHHEWPTG